MSVNWPKIAQSHLLENQAAAITATAIRLASHGAGLQADFRQRAFKTFLGFVRQLERHLALWQTPQEPLKIFGQFVIGWMGYQFIEIGRDGADILSDAPLIVV